MSGAPDTGFVAHFAPLATHADSRELLTGLGARVERMSIETTAAFPLDTRGKLAGEVLVVHFRASARARPGDGPTTWTCAPPAATTLPWLPPDHAAALAIHNGIAHRYGPLSRLEPIHLCRLSARDRASVLASRRPVVEHRSDGYFYARGAIARFGHDADGLSRPYRKDLTAGDHFLAFTALEIVVDGAEPDRKTSWFPT